MSYIIILGETMRKIRRKSRKKIKKTIIFSLVFLFLIMVTGYAAFSTNLNITAKGNIKSVYQTVSFKTQLLENNTFENGSEGWNKNGCDSGNFEISDTVTYNGYNSVRIYEDGGNVYCWNGIYQQIHRIFDTSKKYEISLYAYRDSSSTFGDLNNTIREYVALGDETGSGEAWIYLENSRYSAINITNDIVPNQTWTYIEDYGNRATNSLSSDFIRSFQIDYLADYTRTETSNIWIALPSFYEVEEKEIKKYSKIGTLPVATKDGYTFVGWYTDEFAGEKIDENFEVTDDVDLFARFEKN